LAFGFLLPFAQAQTPPAPTTTFTAGGDNLWKTDANWSLADTPTASDNARINDGQTVAHDIAVLIDGAEMVFGTLTLGASSTFQFNAGNNLGFPTGSKLYFSNGSHLQYTAGSVNRNNDFYILPGASATITAPQRLCGTIQGAGNLTMILTTSMELRSVCSSLTGNMTFLSNNSTARLLSPSFGGTIGGHGTITIGDHVYLDSAGSINSAVTLVLAGAGTSGYKWQTGNTWTGVAVSNFVIDSPSVSVPLIITGSSSNPGGINASDTVTFQGTAATVVVHNASQAYFSGNPRGDVDDIATTNLIFKGTGDWTFIGTRADTNMALGYIKIKSPGGKITTDANAAISPHSLKAPSGFIKAGSGTLTLGDQFGVATPITLSEGGLVFLTNVTFGVSDYVTFEVLGTYFTADFGGSFANLAAVTAAIGDTGNFRKSAGRGILTAKDNGDATFTVKYGPPSGTVITIR